MDRNNEMEESSQLLSLECFSYRWLVDRDPFSDSRTDSFRASIDAASEEGSFIEMDPRSPPSKRFIISRMKSTSTDFKFDFPVLKPPDYLVPADELFAEGFVLPLFVDRSDVKADDQYIDLRIKLGSTKPPAMSGCSCRPKSVTSSSSKTWRRRWLASRRLFYRHLDFLMSMYRAIFRCGTRRVLAARKSVHPADLVSDPMTSRCAYSMDDDRRCSWVDSESPIHEAVLHCKRSNGINHETPEDNSTVPG
ncbi:hypothetical protein SAY87_027166 [Trapa incisa]|uniref:Membrane-associated kinase regulator 6 n=1 Tax=Trapa incisa TaxID=236973 RepID=A0AAN7GYT3_9MYRT|nr:hypothetical protein SAY87_027166 [Trapa incisa]